MTATEVRHPAGAAGEGPSGLRGWATRHQVGAFVALTYLLSWSAWLVAWLLGGDANPLAMVVFVLGGFGPPLAAWAVTWYTGGSVRRWARRIVRWRVPARYYAYALGLPALLYGVMNVVRALLGQDVDLGLLPGRLPAYAGTFLATLTIFGALEEPGWRGFALPRLQQRHTPVRATLLLGLAWGVWHVPLYGPLGFAVPLVLAFYYTWLVNRGGSVLLAILLHASFTPAQDHLILTATESHGLTDAVIGGTYLAGALLLVLATRGRLGLRAPERETTTA